MIEVINPNSSAQMTAAIRVSCEASGVRSDLWVVGQLDEAPPAIETAADVAVAGELVERRAAGVDILIVACHADPGVLRARKRARLVFGIGETSMHAAASVVEKFGVITVSSDAIPRKWDALERYGLRGRCAAVVATERGVLDGLRLDVDPKPYLLAAREAVRSGARALVLGCAGMTPLLEVIREDTGVPVIDPVQVTLRIANQFSQVG